MINKQIIEELLQTKKFKNLLRDYLARKVSDEYHFQDCEGELIKREVRALIVEEAKIAIKELVEDYYELKNVKELIQQEIGKFTKKELIDLINL